MGVFDLCRRSRHKCWVFLNIPFRTGRYPVVATETWRFERGQGAALNNIDVAWPYKDLVILAWMIRFLACILHGFLHGFKFERQIDSDSRMVLTSIFLQEPRTSDEQIHLNRQKTVLQMEGE